MHQGGGGADGGNAVFCSSVGAYGGRGRMVKAQDCGSCLCGFDSRRSPCSSTEAKVGVTSPDHVKDGSTVKGALGINEAGKRVQRAPGVRKAPASESSVTRPATLLPRRSRLVDSSSSVFAAQADVVKALA